MTFKDISSSSAKLITTILITLLAACGSNTEPPPSPADMSDAGADMTPDIEQSCVASGPDEDEDGDGIHDDCDVCEGDDFSGDADQDGICDDVDACPLDAPNDTDGDGYCDSADLCDGDDNADKDGDGYICRRDCDDDDDTMRPDALWWPDNDQDGVGDGGAVPLESCTRPEGYVNNDLDCEDSRSWIHPGAPEVCDGYDSDCDPSTAEEQGVVYARRDGAFIEVTQDFDAGTPSTPLSWASARDEQIFFCGYDVSATFDIRHDVELRFDEQSAIVLDSPQGRPLFDVNPDAVPDGTTHDEDISLTLSGVRLGDSEDPLVKVQSASARIDESTLESFSAQGGSIAIALESDLSMNDVTVHQSRGPVVRFEGRAIDLATQGRRDKLAMRDVEATLTLEHELSGGVLSIKNASSDLFDLEIEGGRSGDKGGAIALERGDARLEAVVIRDTSAETGGAIWANQLFDLHILDLRTEDTRADAKHGGVMIEESDLTMEFVSLERGRDLDASGLLYIGTSSGEINDIILTDGRTHEGAGLVLVEHSMLSIDNAVFTGGKSEYPTRGRGIGGMEAGAGAMISMNNVGFYGNEGMEVGALRAVGGLSFERAHVTITGGCTFHLNRTRNVGVGGQQNAPGAIRADRVGIIAVQGCDMGTPNSSPYNDNSPDDIYGSSDAINTYASLHDYASAVFGGFLKANRAYLNCGLCSSQASCYRSSLNPSCDTEAGAVDGDGDGISNAFERCHGKSDFDDEDGDLSPCLLDANDGDAPCAPGEVMLANGLCSAQACVESGGECQLATSCLDLLSKQPRARSGIYELDLDGDAPEAPIRAYCDMETDGGGWTLVLNYNRPRYLKHPPTVLHGALPIPSMRIDGTLRRTPSWGHASNALLDKLSPTEVRFWGATGVANHEVAQPERDRLDELFLEQASYHHNVQVMMHFKSDDPACLSYLTTGTGSCQNLAQQFTPFDGHTSDSPGSATSFNADRGDLALVDGPFDFFNSTRETHQAGRGGNPASIFPGEEPVWQKVWVR